MSKANFKRLMEGLEEAHALVEGRAHHMRITRPGVAVDVRRVRAKLGITQPKMALLLGISTSGLRKWEQGKRLPSGAALTLLRVADKFPEAVLQVVQQAA